MIHGETEIELTYTEFEILLLLAQNAGIVFSKEQIYDCVWKEPYFGDYNIVAEDLKDINALLDSDKDYCYIACPPVMIDSMIMGVLNKKGELYTFIYDQKRDEMALNRLADFSCKNINLPITSIGSNFLVSYFNKDIYSSYSQSDELNFELKNKIDQGAFVLCLNKIRGEI